MIKPLLVTSFLIFGLTASAYAAADVYYSVGQNTTNHSSGGNVSITSGVATFTVAQSAANLGVGDRLTAGGNVYYLASKISATQWNVVTKLGAVPTNLALTAVTSIAHEYTSLSAAIVGAKDANHINNTSLVVANVILNIPCYYDSDADITNVIINGYTTGVNNYIRIYTPNNTSTECNQSQRHAGEWDDTKYVISATNGKCIDTQEMYTQIIGLQFLFTENRNGYNMSAGIYNNWNYNGGMQVDSCIFKGVTGSSADNAAGIYWNKPYGLDIAKYRIQNCAFIGSGPGTRHSGVDLYGDNTDNGGNIYVCNCTFKNLDTGVRAKTDTGVHMFVKNCGFSNVTSPTSGTLAGSITNSTSTPTFAPGKQFLLDSSDTTWKNQGTDLSGDVGIINSYDFESQSRPYGSDWDIGADEYVPPTTEDNAIFFGTNF